MKYIALTLAVLCSVVTVAQAAPTTTENTAGNAVEEVSQDANPEENTTQKAE